MLNMGWSSFIRDTGVYQDDMRMVPEAVFHLKELTNLKACFVQQVKEVEMKSLRSKIWFENAPLILYSILKLNFANDHLQGWLCITVTSKSCTCHCFYIGLQICISGTRLKKKLLHSL